MSVIGEKVRADGDAGTTTTIREMSEPSTKHPEISTCLRVILEDSILDKIMQGRPALFPLADLDICNYFEDRTTAASFRCATSMDDLVVQLQNLGLSQDRLGDLLRNLESYGRQTGVALDLMAGVMAPGEIMLNIIDCALWTAWVEETEDAVDDPGSSNNEETAHDAGTGGGGQGRDGGGYRGKQKADEGKYRSGAGSGSGGAGEGSASGGGVKGAKVRVTRAAKQTTFLSALRATKRNERGYDQCCFPAENERFYGSAQDFLSSPTTAAVLSTEDVEYGPTVEDASGSTNMAEWWQVKVLAEKKSVFHGLPGWKYLRLIRYGQWTAVQSRPKGELYPGQAVYFATSRAWALWFSGFANAVGVRELAVRDAYGVVVETVLAEETRFAVVHHARRADFVKYNCSPEVLRNPTWNIPIVLSGFLQAWAHKYRNQGDIADVLRTSHQLAVLDTAAVQSVCNKFQSHIAIISHEKILAKNPEDET